AGVDDRTDVHISAALLSVDDSKTRRAANRWRRRSTRATAGGMAAAGPLFEHDQSQFDARVELLVQDTSPPERACDKGHLHRIRFATENPATARCHRRLARHRLVRRFW